MYLGQLNWAWAEVLSSRKRLIEFAGTAAHHDRCIALQYRIKALRHQVLPLEGAMSTLILKRIDEELASLETEMRIHELRMRTSA